MNNLLKLDTPCIGICSTVYGDTICRGCKRTAEEIIDWNKYSHAEKQPIFIRLEKLLATVMQEKISIVAAAMLRAALEHHQVRYRADSDPLCWAYHLLRVGAHKINEIKNYGIQVNAVYRNYSLTELFKLIDAEFLHAASQ